MFNVYFLFLLAVPPLFVIEFLHRVVDIFEDYFQGCSESVLKEYYVIVYEVRINYSLFIAFYFRLIVS